LKINIRSKGKHIPLIITVVVNGHVVTTSDRWVSTGYSGFLPHEDQNKNIDANEHD